MSRHSRERQEKRQQKEYARIAERTAAILDDPNAREKELQSIKDDNRRAAEILNNPVSRFAVASSVRGTVVHELQNAKTEDQIEALGNTIGGSSKLRKSIMNSAPKEMDKAIAKYRKEGKPLTVDSLLVEVRETSGFLKMCADCGITYQWFENLARERMTANGIQESNK